MKISIKNLITVFLFLAVLLGSMIGIHYGLKTTKENNVAKQLVGKYQLLIGENISKVEVVEDKGVDTVKEKFNAFNSAGTHFATLYEATKANDYGSITLRVVVDATGKIIGIEGLIDQSIGANLTKVYAEGYKNSNLSDPKVDGVTAPSVIFSVATVDELIKDIAKSHGSEVVVEETIYEKLFGKEAKLGDVLVLDEGLVTGLQEVLVDSRVVGHVYYIEGAGEKVGGDSESIELKLIVDPFTTMILGHDFDLEKYNHTSGFRKHVDNFINNLLVNKVTVLEFNQETIVSDIDAESGASTEGIYNSVELAIKLIADLNTYLKTIYTVSEIETLENEFVKTKQTITINGITYTNYYVEKLGVYINDDDTKKAIGLNIVIDKFLNIKAVSIVKYEHTDRETFSKHPKNFIKYVLNNNINLLDINTDLDIDGESGASTNGIYNSVRLVIEIFEALKEEVKDTLVYGSLVEVNEGSVKTSQTLKVDEEDFVVYYIEKTGTYRDDNEEVGAIGLEVIVNSLNEVVQIKELKYEHTPSNNFKKHAINFIDMVVTNNLNISEINNDTEVDQTSGASTDGVYNSVELIMTMFEELNTHIKGGN